MEKKHMSVQAHHNKKYFSLTMEKKNIECASKSQHEKINEFAMEKRKEKCEWVHCNKEIEKRVHGLIVARNFFSEVVVVKQGKEIEKIIEHVRLS